MLLAVLAGLTVARFLVDRFAPHLYAGTVLQESETAPSLNELRFASGEPADLSMFEGEVALVFFGYTNCPDVCPMTLSTVRSALDGLQPDERDRVNMLMVSVDTERDDLTSLQEYVSFFDPTFLGVGGSQDAVDRAATVYGVFYDVGPVDEDNGTYLVDHTASLMGIDPDGALRIVWAPDVTATALSNDLRELLS